MTATENELCMKSYFMGSSHHLLNMAGFQMFLRMNIIAFNLETDAGFYRGLMPEWLAVLFNQLLRCKQRQHGITEEISTCKLCKPQCFLGEEM